MRRGDNTERKLGSESTSSSQREKKRKKEGASLIDEQMETKDFLFSPFNHLLHLHLVC